MSACEALAAPVAAPRTPSIIAAVTASASTSATPRSHSRSCSPPTANDTDSGKSSCSPALLDCSFDSGIGGVGAAIGSGVGSGVGSGSGVEGSNMELQRKIVDYQRLLVTIDRDRELYRLLRERLSQIIKKNNKKQSQEEVCCNICCAELDVDDAKSSVQCSVCRKAICRGLKCADWVPGTARWECQLCRNSKESLAHTSSWVAEQMSFNQHKFVYPVRARSEIYIPISDPNDSSMHFESVSQVGGYTAPPADGVNGNSSGAISAEQKLKIREYVEEVVAKMLGGSLDQVAVGQLSRSENYLSLFRKFHSKLSDLFVGMERTLTAAMRQRDLPALVNGHANHNNNNNNSTSFTDVSQTRLRQLIETIIAETLRQPAALSSAAVSEVAFDTHSHGGSAHTLPNGNAIRRHRTEHYFEPKIYQDLLATAVLNKIADSHGNARHLSESSPDLTAPDGSKNYKENQSTSSGSSIEPRSDCSFTDTDQILNISKGADFSPCGSHTNLNADALTNLQLDAGRESALSDYIASHMVPLPDLSAPATESEEDDYPSITSSQLADGNWEKNWLFKKKRSSLSSTVTAGSVGMLVPAPKEDVRAQIGDKLADEISDLSEVGSDTDDSSLDILRSQLDPLNDRLLNKHLIGGQNTKMVLDELIDRASMISSTSLAENEPTFTETKNENVIKPTTKTEAINTTVTQSILENSPPSTDTMMDPSGPELIPPPCTFGDVANGVASQEETTSNTITGSIAEREYKKWYNAVDMPNNPYAPEALKRRISGSQERFMDLPNISPSTEQNPITLMKNATTDELDGSEHCPERDYKRYSRDYYINDIKSSTTSIKSSTSTFTDSLTTSQDPADITINEAEIANATATTTPSEHVFQALPAQVVEEPDAASLETLSTLSNPSVQSVTPTTTSDDSDTIRIYDFKKQATTVIRDPKPAANSAPTTHALTAAPTQSTSLESNLEESPKHVPRKDRPKDLAIFAGNGSSESASGVALSSPFTPTRGSTPTAFKFLQPKRKLIDPSQVLSFDEDYEPPTTPPERKPIEDEVAQALPSVKALAQAFLMTSHKNPKLEKRVPVKVKTIPDPVTSSPPAKKLQPSPSTIELAEDATIASDLSSLETDPPTLNENKDSIAATATSPVSGKTSPVPVRTGVLRSKLAFFENLKFK